MHKIIFFLENLEKFLGFTSKRYGWVIPNTGIFFLPHKNGHHMLYLRKTVVLWLSARLYVEGSSEALTVLCP